MAFNGTGQRSPAKILLSPCLLALFTGALLVLGACSGEPDIPGTVGVHDVALQGYDPVSYFLESAPVKGTAEYEHRWNRMKYRFSCRENLELFQSGPARYAPQYNGYCAFALSRGDYSDTDPEAYAVVDGKLYLTYDRHIKNAWLQDKENYIIMADRNWRNSKFNDK